MIETLSERLINLKLDELSQAVTELNNKLAHDRRIAQIKIKPSGDFQLLGENGAEISSSLSAGQMQILIMALVSGLAHVTGYEAPYVIDTPLARLDADHRQSLFRHWSSLNQQVILLSQDTEITPEVKSSLAQHVQKTYLVKAESLATGGARSSLIEDSYFN
jgi:DNA sulfur modification protein DndD